MVYELSSFDKRIMRLVVSKCGKGQALKRLAACTNGHLAHGLVMTRLREDAHGDADQILRDLRSFMERL